MKLKKRYFVIVPKGESIEGGFSEVITEEDLIDCPPKNGERAFELEIKGQVKMVNYQQNNRNKMKKPNKQLLNLYKSLGLEETTTPRQKKNGTYMFEDKRIKNVWYTFHTKTGYYRRRTLAFPHNLYFCGRKFEHYQLNRTYVEDGHTIRILEFDIDRQMTMAIRPIVKYRFKKLA